MASIYINEVDGTVYGLSATSSSNVVFIPGSAITGPSEPTLCGSFIDFTSKFGNVAPSKDDKTVGTSWDYAADMLLAGFPVLFQRITSSTSGSPLVTKANGKINVGEDEVGTITEIYGGSFGNSISCSIIVNSLSIYLRTSKVYKIGTTSYNKQLESIKIVDKKGTDTTEDLVNRIKSELTQSGSSYIFDKSEYVTVSLTTAALETFAANTTNLTGINLSGGIDADDTEVAKVIPSVYANLKDNLIYNIKFITAGGYYNMSYSAGGDVTNTIDVVTPMVELAEARKDCVAFPDIPLGTDKDDAYNYFTSLVDSSYAAAYAPWAYMELESSTGTSKWMPPSFVFLHTLARSVKSGNPLWFPPAGVRRATVGEISKTEYEVGSVLLDQWQNNNPQYINPIMRVRNYGYVIYGQRTLYRSVDGSIDNRSALQELGVRITANEIKRRITDIALELTFEQNNLRTWNEFRGLLNPYLLQMQTDGALYGYEIIMDTTTTTSADIDENRIVGIVRANITRAAEDFEIGFELSASSVQFTDSNN